MAIEIPHLPEKLTTIGRISDFLSSTYGPSATCSSDEQCSTSPGLLDSSGGFAVTSSILSILSQECIDWYTSKLSAMSLDLDSNDQFAPLIPLLQISVNTPFHEPYMNLGVIDGLFSIGQILASPSAVSLISTSSFPQLAKVHTNSVFWSLKETRALLSCSSTAEALKKFAASYPYRTEGAIKGRFEDIKLPHWFPTAPTAPTASLSPSIMTKIRASDFAILFEPFSASRTVESILEELFVLSCVSNTDFNNLISYYSSLSVTTVDLISSLISADCTVEQQDCLIFRPNLIGLTTDLNVGCSGGVKKGRKFYRRELISIFLIQKLFSSEGDCRKAYAETLGACSNNSRKPENCFKDKKTAVTQDEMIYKERVFLETMKFDELRAVQASKATGSWADIIKSTKDKGVDLGPGLPGKSVEDYTSSVASDTAGTEEPEWTSAQIPAEGGHMGQMVSAEEPLLIILNELRAEREDARAEREDARAEREDARADRKTQTDLLIKLLEERR